VASGAWLQLTGNAITGHFGPDVAKLSERFLRDGLVHIVASDAHDAIHRPPVLSRAYERCVALVGEAEAEQLFVQRPRAILDNANPVDVAPPTPELKASGLKGLLTRWLQ
jgi:protein-tyrosine phosphatase